MDPVILALVVVAGLFIASAVCFAFLHEEVVMTDEHDALFNRYEY